MIAPAKPRKKKASASLIANGRNVARLGGGKKCDTDTGDAPKNNRIDDFTSGTVPKGVDPAAGDRVTANDQCGVGRKSKRGEGASARATERRFAAPRKSRRSVLAVTPKNVLNGSGGSDVVRANEPKAGSPRKTKGRSNPHVSPTAALSGQGGSGGDLEVVTDAGRASICRQLQELQRQKSVFLKSRIMIDNRLAANVSTMMGYSAGMEEKERKAVRAEAESLIAALDKGDPVDAKWADLARQVSSVVQSTRIARNGFDHFLSGIEKEMIRLAKQLPAAKWIEDADRRSFGILSLATVIGETGDLSLYANPAKVWKRLGLAPFQGKMPSTWRKGKEGKLSAEQWMEIGYSPRRRSIMFVVGENIVKQNKGSYRQRYDEAKAAAHANHPDWSDGRCHWHGMLLATKRLIRDLWKEWNRA